MDEPRRYRKLPVVVDAIRWTGENEVAIVSFAGHHVRAFGGTIDVWIEKSQAWRQGLPVGDWVIAETDGVGFYPCTAQQFAETYEPVE